MTNNDILRRVRYAFDFSNKEAASLFSLDPNSSAKMTQAQFLNRVAKEEDQDFIECDDLELMAFLDGLIVKKRGLKQPVDGAKTASKPEVKAGTFLLSKNDILKKLRIAMSFQEADMLSTLALGGSELSKSELGALFRKPNHKHYRKCGNQVLRNFIKGLTLTLRSSETSSTQSADKPA